MYVAEGCAAHGVYEKLPSYQEVVQSSDEEYPCEDTLALHHGARKLPRLTLATASGQSVLPTYGEALGALLQENQALDERAC